MWINTIEKFEGVARQYAHQRWQLRLINTGEVVAVVNGALAFAMIVQYRGGLDLRGDATDDLDKVTSDAIEIIQQTRPGAGYFSCFPPVGIEGSTELVRIEDAEVRSWPRLDLEANRVLPREHVNDAE